MSYYFTFPVQTHLFQQNHSKDTIFTCLLLLQLTPDDYIICYQFICIHALLSIHTNIYPLAINSLGRKKVLNNNTRPNQPIIPTYRKTPQDYMLLSRNPYKYRHNLKAIMGIASSSTTIRTILFQQELQQPKYTTRFANLSTILKTTSSIPLQEIFLLSQSFYLLYNY